MKRILPFCVLLITIVACENMSEEEIEQQISSGVVLIQNQSYYEVTLPNEETIYFSYYDEEDGIQGLKFDLDSVELATSYGTGFFISSDGKIATNNHVVSNVVEDKDVHKSIAKFFDALKGYLAVQYEEYDEAYDKMCSLVLYAFYDDNVSVSQFNELRDMRDALENERDNYARLYNYLDNMRAKDCEISYHNEVGIAYNNTYVTNSGDFTPCVITKRDAENDLAIIQLKDKRTPEDKYVFEVPEEDPLVTYSTSEKITKKISDDKNAKLFMVSFNLGPILALTQDGVKSQFNNGTISQKTSKRIMYSIPALHGSSGSPVVNLQGQLVAVNFASVGTTGNFNYGIRVKQLRDLPV